MKQSLEDKKKKYIRLSKKRLKALDLAISIDDVLYEKYRRLNEYLNKRAQQMYKVNQVMQVIRVKNKSHYIEQITEEVKTHKGIIVYIK